MLFTTNERVKERFYLKQGSPAATSKHQSGSRWPSRMYGTLTFPVGVSSHISALRLRRPTTRQREKPPIHFVWSRFCGQNAAEVRAVSRQDGRREPSVFHHRRNRTEPPGRPGDRQENDQNGKGNETGGRAADLFLTRPKCVCFPAVWHNQDTPGRWESLRHL